ncbi:glyceraldehyde-3-phosphate dehydrogenase [Salipiger sp.]
MSIINSFRRHRAYRRTLNELRSLSLRTRLDCDFAGIEDRIARRAVYGA